MKKKDWLLRMARRKAKKTVKKSSPSPGRDAKDEAANELKSDSDEDGMFKFVAISIFSSRIRNFI